MLFLGDTNDVGIQGGWGRNHISLWTKCDLNDGGREWRRWKVETAGWSALKRSGAWPKNRFNFCLCFLHMGVWPCPTFIPFHDPTFRSSSNYRRNNKTPYTDCNIAISAYLSWRTARRLCLPVNAAHRPIRVQKIKSRSRYAATVWLPSASARSEQNWSVCSRYLPGNRRATRMWRAVQR
jgi:hypothetical protein